MCVVKCDNSPVFPALTAAAASQPEQWENLLLTVCLSDLNQPQ